MFKLSPAFDSATVAIARAAARTAAAAPRLQGTWTEDEHDRFLEAMQLYPTGPWKDITAHIGTRSVRQVQTHAQKYHEKIERRMRGLRKERKRLLRPEHRLDPNAPVLGDGSRSSFRARASTVVSNDSSASDSDVCKSETVATSDECDSDRASLLDDLDDHCLDYLLHVLGSMNDASAQCSDSSRNYSGW